MILKLNYGAHGQVALEAEKSGLLIQCRKTIVGSNPTLSSSNIFYADVAQRQSKRLLTARSRFRNSSSAHGR